MKSKALHYLVIFFHLFCAFSPIESADHSSFETSVESLDSSEDFDTPKDLAVLNKEKKIFIGCFFSHGLGGTANQADWYAGFNAIGDGSIVVPRLVPYETFSFNYPEIYNGTTEETSLGQENEIKIFDDAFNKMIDTIKKRGFTDIYIILYGVSRGASTILNWMSQHPESRHYIIGAILESPFDSVENVFDHIVSQMKMLKHFIPRTAVRWLVRRVSCGSYKEDGLQPIDAIKLIKHKDIPMLFIWSKTDSVISYKNSQNLYLSLRKLGHKKVRYISCKLGCHASILWGPDGQSYKVGVERFLASIIPKPNHV